MKSGEGISKGVGACQEALQRLLDGKPFYARACRARPIQTYREHRQS